MPNIIKYHSNQYWLSLAKASFLGEFWGGFAK